MEVIFSINLPNISSPLPVNIILDESLLYRSQFRQENRNAPLKDDGALTSNTAAQNTLHCFSDNLPSFEGV